ncbi:MAG TPA: hypothetical protein VFO79_09500 [Xanthomonadales bacterium]|nr:hypothetical protein [Xanthomonadales bacterium]
MTFRSTLFAATLLVLPLATAAKESMPISDALAAKLTANPDRSYPPSCLSYPLPTTVRGTPVVLQNVRLGDFEGNYEERLTVTMWRVACSGGKSAVLVKFQRPSNAPNNQFADVPIPFVTQGAFTQRLARLHFEPNTVNSEVNGHSIGGDVTLVLEATSGDRIDFNQAFRVELGTIVANQAFLYAFDMPAYNAAQHPDGALALEITGYVSGSWYDPARGGEGMIVEVGERASGAKYAGFAWYTYDAQGNPSWIVGNQDLPTTGAVPRTVTIPGLYLRGGGFAGNFNPSSLDARPWGTVTLTFPSCNAMRLDYASAATPPPGAPTGSGTRNWQRLVTLNGLPCE